MNAREYINEKHPDGGKPVYFSEDAMASFMEDYHTLKSQEEAEERYVIARDNIIKQLGGISIFLKMQLRIASGKTEDHGTD